MSGSNDKANETSLILSGDFRLSPGDLGLCANRPKSDGNGVVIGYIRDMDTSKNNWA